MENEQASQIKSETRRWQNQVAQVLAKIENVEIHKVFLPQNPDSLFLMLNWKVWCLRYHVDLEFILRTLFHRYSSIRNKTRGPGLRLEVSMLTGNAARVVIEEAVAERYPNQENQALTRNDFQQCMLGNPGISQITGTNLNKAVANYQTRMEQRRKNFMDARQTFKRRPWRGNPWR